MYNTYKDILVVTIFMDLNECLTCISFHKEHALQDQQTSPTKHTKKMFDEKLLTKNLSKCKSIWKSTKIDKGCEWFFVDFGQETQIGEKIKVQRP